METNSLTVLPANILVGYSYDRLRENGPELLYFFTDILNSLVKRLLIYFRYDVILRNGLPDWRQPVFYYRRVRKMGILEFLVFIFVIFTVGHFIIAWSIYLERKFELVSLVFKLILIQGSYGPWETWKTLDFDFNPGNSLDVLEFRNELENSGKLHLFLKYSKY